MIQRPQSLILLLTALCGIALFFFPLFSFDIVDNTFDVYITGVRNLDPNSALNFNISLVFHLIILIVIILTAVGVIFLYKNRPVQIKLCRFGIMASIVFVFLIFMFADTIKNRFVEKMELFPEFVKPSFGVGSILPIVMLVLFFVAIYFIRKDEKLVKAADRLR